MITADDTTGALESAARIADEGWEATVVPHSLDRPVASPVAATRAAPSGVVVDLRSRHATADVAAARLSATLLQHAQALDASPVRVHKIDSTLRGNWPAEIAASTRSGRRVVMVPAYPAAGRICRGGVVTEHGVPVDRSDHVNDPRAPVLTSRPASLLDDAVELSTVDDVVEWLERGRGGVAVADAGDDHEVAAVVQFACAYDDVLLVGPAAVVGAAARHLAPSSLDARRSSAIATQVVAPVLVVCGSLHPISRQQVEALLRAGARSISSGAIESQSSSASAPVSVLSSSAHLADDPSAVVASLARDAQNFVRSACVRTVVLLGGDTAESFIDDRVVHVAGSLDVGVALGSMSLDGAALTLVAKPGAFGSTNTLVDLMNDLLTGSAG